MTSWFWTSRLWRVCKFVGGSKMDHSGSLGRWIFGGNHTLLPCANLHHLRLTSALCLTGMGREGLLCKMNLSWRALKARRGCIRTKGWVGRWDLCRFGRYREFVRRSLSGGSPVLRRAAPRVEAWCAFEGGLSDATGRRRLSELYGKRWCISWGWRAKRLLELWWCCRKYQ